MEQRTEEWMRARIGKFTASNAHRALAKIKSGWGAERENYKAELLTERRTGAPYPHYVSPAMQHGIDNEAAARDAYVWELGLEVVEVGFIDHPHVPMSGCSPDGYVGGDGLVEFKCPGSAEHIRLLTGGEIPRKYLLQMQWQMACTGRKWCDFVSFDPRLLDPDERLEIRRVHRDGQGLPQDIPGTGTMEDAARVFLAEVDADMRKLDERIARRRRAA